MTSAQLAIAEDYYFSPLTIAQISEKHNVNQPSVTRIAYKVDFRRFHKQKDYCVIKVEKGDLETATMILREYGIVFEMPEKYELTEFFESKINQE